MEPISTVKVLDHGSISLMKVWGSDEYPARVARTSFRNSDASKSQEENLNLVRYLKKHQHMTPFEFCGAQFYVEMPIFVARQWVRHRSASINEESLRYVEARETFYVPSLRRMNQQSSTNKQGSSDLLVDYPGACEKEINRISKECLESYRALMEMGLAKEIARIVLPLNIYTGWYWQSTLRGIMHFLDLRLDKHAQYEIRVYAHAMLELLQPVFPTILEDYE